METLEKMIMRKSDIIIDQPKIVGLYKQDITIVNPNLPNGIIVHQPNVTYAIWNPQKEAEIATNLTIVVGVYLPEHSDFNLKSVICNHCIPDTTQIAQGYKILFDFPENEKFDYYRLYKVVIEDALDVRDPEHDGTEFAIEVFLGDSDPKTSRGTVTTVIKSA